MVIFRSAKKLNPHELAETLDCAIREVERHYVNDSKFPTLEEQLKISGISGFLLLSRNASLKNKFLISLR